jgi:disulfide bond formation protein DsbB
MKKLFKPLVCVFSTIALILMLIGIILGLVHSRLFQIRPAMWYFSSVNLILFAILFHFAGSDSEPEKKS